jgi:RimJ/RimL family protein N-acetyltransferase
VGDHLGMRRDIDTARLRLRPLSWADVDDLVMLHADPAVMAFVNGGRPASRAAVEQSLGTLHSHRWVARGEDGGFVGWVDLRPTAAEGGDAELELSYRLRRASWGKGLASEAATAVVAHAFEHLGADLVRAQTAAANRGSQRVLERCGLRFAGRTGPARRDLEYRLTRAQWAGDERRRRPAEEG